MTSMLLISSKNSTCALLPIEILLFSTQLFPLRGEFGAGLFVLF